MNKLKIAQAAALIDEAAESVRQALALLGDSPDTRQARKWLAKLLGIKGLNYEIAVLETAFDRIPPHTKYGLLAGEAKKAVAELAGKASQ